MTNGFQWGRMFVHPLFGILPGDQTMLLCNAALICCAALLPFLLLYVHSALPYCSCATMTMQCHDTVCEFESTL